MNMLKTNKSSKQKYVRHTGVLISLLHRATSTSQDQLAEKLSVSRQTIISLEKEKYNPSIILAFKLAEIFNCKIEDVFIYEEDSE